MTTTDDDDAPRHAAERKSDPLELPVWFRVLVIGGLATALVVQIFVDAFVETYEGTSQSLMLGGIVGTALGVNDWLRRRGGGSDR